jgi:two-component system CheB/CheR fusion protein
MARKIAAKSKRTRAKAGAPRASPRPSFPIGAAGASAGGLGAVTGLLKALLAHSGRCFVLIQHLDLQHERVLTQILSNATRMPVLEAT